MSSDWYTITNEQDVESPALLLYPDRIRENIRRMIAIAGDPARLRPHVKTHKLPGVIRMQVEAGIVQFKCATLSEAAMVAENGGKDILVAYPLYGPAVDRLFGLIKKYPDIGFSMLIDHEAQARAIAGRAESAGLVPGVYIDLNVGMNRTGIEPGPDAMALYRLLENEPRLQLRGLHIYDGHLHQADRAEREANCTAGFKAVNEMIAALGKEGLRPQELVCGGTPTFPIHAGHPERTLSPGTVLLWDWGYSTKFQDLDFQHATVLLTRVISKPGKNKLCLDLGHKAVASEMTPPRVHFMGISDYEHLGHSEEHLVIAFEGAERFSAGDCLYGIPMHICPTVALHDAVWAVSGHRAVEKWRVTARTREMPPPNTIPETQHTI